MGLFSRNKKVISDPVFGEITSDGKSVWQGLVPLEGEKSVVVRVMAGEEGPSKEQRATFIDLKQRYGALRPAIAEELFGLYRPYLEESAQMQPRPANAQEMMGLMILDWIEIHAGALIRLGYGFVDGAGWDDAMFSVRIEDWHVKGESLDD